MTRRLAIIGVTATCSAMLAAPAPDVFARDWLVPGIGRLNAANPARAENKEAPVQIEAAKLEVHDKTKTATFSGNVRLVQGDTTIQCGSLVVFYDEESGLGEAAIATMSKRIRGMEARGAVTVRTKDQCTIGDLGIYDIKTRTLTLSGDVMACPQVR